MWCCRNTTTRLSSFHFTYLITDFRINFAADSSSPSMLFDLVMVSNSAMEHFASEEIFSDSSSFDEATISNSALEFHPLEPVVLENSTNSSSGSVRPCTPSFMLHQSLFLTLPLHQFHLRFPSSLMEAFIFRFGN